MAEIDVKGKEDRTAQGEQRGQVARRTGGGLSQRGFSPWLSLRPMDFWSMNPWDLMRRFSEEMDRAFQGWASAGGGEAWGYSPAVETFQRGSDLVVRADLPGVQEKDVKVELTDDGLVISGERRRDFEDKGEGYYRSEHSYGRFHRLVPLPPDVEEEKARASFKNGVLEVSMPMPESKARRRQIRIGTETGAATGAASKPAASKEKEREPELVGAGSSSKTGTTR